MKLRRISWGPEHPDAFADVQSTLLKAVKSVYPNQVPVPLHRRIRQVLVGVSDGDGREAVVPTN